MLTSLGLFIHNTLLNIQDQSYEFSAYRELMNIPWGFQGKRGVPYIEDAIYNSTSLLLPNVYSEKGTTAELKETLEIIWFNEFIVEKNLENELSKITQLFSRTDIRTWVCNSAPAQPTFRNWIEFNSTEAQSCSTKEVKGIIFFLNSLMLSTKHMGKADDSFWLHTILT